MLTGQSYPGYTGTLPDDHLRALRKLLDEIEEETDFEAMYGAPLNGLGIDEQQDVKYGDGTAGEHWPKRPLSDNTPDSDLTGDSAVETVQQQSSEVAK